MNVESPLTPAEQHLNILADACLEMYNPDELASTKRVLRELQATYPDVPSEQLLAAIQRALTWQLQGGNGVNNVH